MLFLSIYICKQTYINFVKEYFLNLINLQTMAIASCTPQHADSFFSLSCILTHQSFAHMSQSG